MKRIGRYHLTRVLGTGGAGSVYEATLHGPGGFRKAVALKVLHREEESLWREARIGGLLRHRHLVDVFEINQEAGQWYCAMELCRGGALRRHMPLPPRAVVDVGLQVCAALEYAHEELGLVHLDLKPENLLLTERAQVKVADLGIALASGFAGDGLIRGTPAYMAPEQANGDAVDARTDVYALGQTLVELATGARTAPPETFTFGVFATTDELPIFGPPADRAIPAWLAPVVSRCLAANPADRWQDMASLGSALKSLQSGLTGPDLAEWLDVEPAAQTRPPRARTNIGEEPNRFVGRQRDLEQLVAGLSVPGVYTLKGPAGMGKTRLATAAARQWSLEEGGQAWFVDLTTTTTLGGLQQAVASALGAAAGQDATDRLGRVLRARGPMVMVLDNFEQLIGHASVMATWSASAPECRFLVTSRTLLGLDDESVVDLAPLQVEDAEQLLTARALLRGADVSRDPDLPALAARLDGLPLAIELAAGRLGVLSARDVLERLDSGVLRSGDEGRHATLQAALQWSWGLLSPDEQSALAQLTAFAGGWSVDAQNAVVRLSSGAQPDDVVDALVAHSLVQRTTARARLLVSVRAFAAPLLLDPDAPRRHATFFATLGTRQAVRALSIRDGSPRRRRLGTELKNIVSACGWATEHAQRRLAVDLMRGCWAVMDSTGPYTVALALATKVLAVAAGEDDAVRADALILVGEANKRAGHPDEAMAQLTEALSSHARRDDLAGQIQANISLGGIYYALGNTVDARALHERTLELTRATGDSQSEGVSLNDLALIDCQEGRPEDARRRYERRLLLARQVGDVRGEGITLGNLGILHDEQGRPEQARLHYQAYLAMARSVGDRRGEGIALGNLGSVEHGLGRLDRARSQYEAFLGITRELGDLRSETVALGNLGTLHQHMGELDVALQYNEAALEISNEIGDGPGRGVTLGNMALIHAALGRKDRARTLLEQAAEAAARIRDVRLEGHWLGHLARQMGGVAALPKLDRGEELLRKVGDLTLLAILLGAKSEVMSGLGRRDEAVAALAEARRVGPGKDPDVDEAIQRAEAALV